MMSEDEQARLSFLVSKEVIEGIENWRRTQPRIPSLAAASRIVLEAGLAALAKKKGRNGNGNGNG